MQLEIILIYQKGHCGVSTLLFASANQSCFNSTNTAGEIMEQKYFTSHI